jgi:hypothetical protein
MVLALQVTELRSASGRLVSGSRHMDSLRWWFLLLAAVLFSMSGCASKDQWNAWTSHPSHYASANHWEFSQRTGGNIDPKIISEANSDVAMKEGWWGDLVPLAPPVDLTGHWVGTWKGLGLFDSLRQSDARMTLLQDGILGVGGLYMSDVVAAGVPWPVRYAGSNGVRLAYRVNGTDAVMRQLDSSSEMILGFTLVGDRLVGTIPGGDPVVITLTRLPAQSASR